MLNSNSFLYKNPPIQLLPRMDELCLIKKTAALPPVYLVNKPNNSLKIMLIRQCIEMDQV